MTWRGGRGSWMDVGSVELLWRAPVPVYCLLSTDAVPGIALGCNCSALFPLSVFILFSSLGSSWECALFGMSRKSAHIAAWHRKQSPRAQNDDVVDGSAVLWCSCRQPQGDRFMIECDLRGENCFHWYHGNCVGITPIDGRRTESQGDPRPFISPFCTTVPCLPPFSASSVPISPGGQPLLLGQLFVKRSIRLMSLLFTEKTISFWFPMVVAALILSLNLLNCMRALALPLLWNVLLWKLPWCYLLSFSRSLTHDPSLMKISIVLNAVCILGMRVILMLCLLKATPSSGIYNIIIAPLQLTALTYLLAWSSKERLKLLCGSLQNSLGAHSCLSPLHLGSLLCLMNLFRNILILPQPLRWTSLILVPPIYRAVILSSLIVWTVILFVVLLFALRGPLDLQKLMLWGGGVYVSLSGLLLQISVIPWL